MEKFAYKIEQLLEKKLLLYREIHQILVEEKAHIARMEVDALWDTTAKKKSLAMSIEVVKRQMAICCKQKYSGLKIDSDTLELSYVIRLLKASAEKKAVLKKTHTAINTVKSDIRILAAENKRFIDDYLSIINGIFSTVLNREDKRGYNKAGSVGKDTSKNYFIRAEA